VSNAILSIAAAMFVVPMLLMLGIALLGADIPSPILSFGGWSMALGIILGGIGAVMAWGEG
jgi:hypothetical protein